MPFLSTASSFANSLIDRMVQHGSHAILTVFVNRGRSEESQVRSQLLFCIEAYQPMNSRTSDLPLLLHYENQGLSTSLVQSHVMRIAVEMHSPFGRWELSTENGDIIESLWSLLSL